MPQDALKPPTDYCFACEEINIMYHALKETVQYIEYSNRETGFPKWNR
jgi:hypothetical protein